MNKIKNFLIVSFAWLIGVALCIAFCIAFWTTIYNQYHDFTKTVVFFIFFAMYVIGLAFKKERE